jgi:hypothetical protein
MDLGKGDAGCMTVAVSNGQSVEGAAELTEDFEGALASGMVGGGVRDGSRYRRD